MKNETPTQIFSGTITGAFRRWEDLRNRVGMAANGRRALALSALLGFSIVSAQAADEYWRTDGTAGGTWTSTFWNIGSANATGGAGWTAGNHAFFTANSTLTYVTGTLFGNVTVSDGITVAVSQAGTASAGAHIYDIGTGATLTWASQNFTASGTSFVKNGAGTWDMASIGNAYTGGSTLNAGTVIVSGTNSLGAATLTINGGTIQSSGSSAYAPTSLVIGGDFTLTGTGTASWAGNVALGSATRTITNNAVASNGATRTFGGIISGATGVGLIIVGTGTGTISNTSTTVLSGANTYSGGTTLNTAGILQLSGSGTLGSTSGSLAVNAGRLDLNGTAQTVGNLTGNGGTIVNNATSTNVTLTIGNGNGTGGNYQGVVANNTANTGTVAITKAGSGTITLSGGNTYTGTTTVQSGTLLLGAANTLKTGSSDATRTAVALTGGKFSTGGFAQGDSGNTLGALTLSATSTLTLGTTGAEVLRFSNLGTTLTTLGATALTIENWSGTVGSTGGGDQILFSSIGSNSISTDYSQIRFDIGGIYYSGAFASVGGGFELYADQLEPIPEPGTIFGALALVGLIGYRERGGSLAGRKWAGSWRSRGAAKFVFVR